MIDKIQNSSVASTSQVSSPPHKPVYASSIPKTQSLYESYVLSPTRTLVRPLFFPLFNKLPLKLEEQMTKEKQFFESFWDPKAPPYPELSHHKKIKDNFTHKNEDFAITLKGKAYMVRCSVIESKNYIFGKACYNVVHVLGITSTLNNTIMHTYPLLASYLDLKGKKSLPARFILVNQYSIYSADGSIYKPETLSEAGLIHSETLKVIEERYGTIHQLLSYSLGTIVTAAALKFFHKDPPENTCSLTGRITPVKPSDESTLKATRAFKSLPKNIIFDRGPSSIEKLSSRYTGGSILLPLARLSDWDVNLGKEIADFIQNCPENAPSITIVNVLQDHRFHGDVTLLDHPDIKRLTAEKKVTSILLDITLQSLHENAQHSFSLGNWYGSHVVEGYKEQKFLQKDQSLATAIIKNSIPSRSN